ncbi:MAG: acyl carrier protein [Promethearchaeota archaeon]
MSEIDKFINLVSETFEIKPEDITDEKTPDEIENWTSVSHMELMSKFEDEWDLEFDVEDITEMDSIGNMKKILKENYGVSL